MDLIDISNTNMQYDMAPCVTRPSAPVVLTVWNKRAFVIHEEGL